MVTAAAMGPCLAPTMATTQTGNTVDARMKERPGEVRAGGGGEIISSPSAPDGEPHSLNAALLIAFRKRVATSLAET